MAKATRTRHDRDPSAGGKRSAMDILEQPAGSPRTRPASSLREGRNVIAEILPTLPSGPGVYRMLNRFGDALYVGKASSLKRRVASYAQPGRLSRRLQRMVAETSSIEVVETGNEDCTSTAKP